MVTYLFTFVAGTGHCGLLCTSCHSRGTLTETKIRPELSFRHCRYRLATGYYRQPISAATVALLGLLTGFDITLFDILKITIPATLIGVLVGAFLSKKVGKELLEDPEYLRRLEAGMIDTKHVELNDVKNMFHARISVIIFIAATLLIVLFGSIPAMRPVFNGAALDMPSIIEILMLCAAAIILIISRTDGIKANKQGRSRDFLPEWQAVSRCIFGIAWMGDYVHQWKHYGTDRFY